MPDQPKKQTATRQALWPLTKSIFFPVTPSSTLQVGLELCRGWVNSWICESTDDFQPDSTTNYCWWFRNPTSSTWDVAVKIMGIKPTNLKWCSSPDFSLLNPIEARPALESLQRSAPGGDKASKLIQKFWKGIKMCRDSNTYFDSYEYS